jgi:cell division transport system permease protein
MADDFKEKIAMTVYMKKEATETDLKQFENQLKKMPYAKSIDFVSREQAAKEQTEIIGEDFLNFLGENPLQDSYDIHVKAAYIQKDSIAKFQKDLSENNLVSEVVYDNELVEMVNENIKKISFWILIASGFLTFVAVLLINSSIRLSIYSNRFIIKTMQMVGATKAFIRWPFLKRNILLGLIGATVAVVCLIALLLYIETNFPEMEILQNQYLTGMVLLGVFGVSIFITWISTHFATQRFLNIRSEELY